MSVEISFGALADEVLVLDGGKVAERGSHRELLAAGGVYARLFELQDDEIQARMR